MKKKYITPKVEIQTVSSECGIAAGSSVLNPGKSSTPFTPEVETWEEGGNDSKFLDI